MFYFKAILDNSRDSLVVVAKRLVLSTLYHGGIMHLVYNMLSLLWKGVHLEVYHISDFTNLVLL